jgi:hypothetical protein
MKLTAALTLIAILPLSACSHSPPSCSDSDATDVVIQIANEQLDRYRPGLARMNEDKPVSLDPTLKDIRTVSKNADTGGYKCAATVDIKSNSPSFAKSVDITYTTEIAEDTHKPYITVYGFAY